MAVAFDAKTATWTQQAGGTSLSVTNLTVGAGSNGAMAILLMCGSNAGVFPSGLAITRGGASISGGQIVLVPNTQFSDSGLTGSGLIYGLLSPASGNTTISVSWTGSNEVFACAISFTGVDQTNVATAFPGGATSTRSTPTAGPVSVVISSASGDMVIAAETQNVAPFGTISGTTLSPESDAGNLGVVSNYDNGAASVTMSAAFTGTSAWAAMGCNVKAAASGAVVEAGGGQIFRVTRPGWRWRRSPTGPRGKPFYLARQPILVPDRSLILPVRMKRRG